MYRQMGNSVAIPVVAAVAKQIAKKLKSLKFTDKVSVPVTETGFMSIAQN
ncbi:MAG: hypothetical protein ACD_20C00200G0002 [uncultured bacterium]|nr:MAG: hypothetical protein ACD_20C00200G0002 [uncultured bacterium]